ncbi:MAG: S1C family serine protease, partial [Desulfobacterales bacterium]|nr:S1C family serine protease [Desulfobacterales bacterium]
MLSHKRLFALLLLCSCGLCSADTIVLKEGQRLTGDILAEKENQLIIDVGAAVLTIPKEKILQYQYSNTALTSDADVNNLPAATHRGEQADANEPQVQGRLYRTANLKKTTIEKCVETFSEAVVKVSSPAGLGSGFFINEDGYLITNY